MWKTPGLFVCLKYLDEYEQHACDAGEVAQSSEPEDRGAGDVSDGVDKAAYEENLCAGDSHLSVNIGHVGGSSYGDVEHEVFK